MLNLPAVASWFARRMRFLLVGGAILLLPLLLATLTPARQATLPPATDPPPYSAVRLPENYRETFIHYATVDRRDQITRDIYISPDALVGYRPNRSLPDGTVVVIEGYYAQTDADGQPLRDDDGHFVRGEPLEMVHVAEKRTNWSPGDFVGAARSGNWNFGSFQYDTGAYFDEIMSRCFDCHNSMDSTDFLYTFADVSRFAQNGLVRYSFCDLSGRSPC